MSNIVMYRKAKRGAKNSDIERISGRLGKSEFHRRTEFIRKRITLGFSQEEIAFLIGRYPGLIRRYEEMSAGIRPENTDIESLSEVMGEDMSPFFPPEGDDVELWEVSGTKQVKGDVLSVEITLETNDKPMPAFKIEEKLPQGYSEEDYRDHYLVGVILERMLNGTYFLSSKSAFEIYTGVQNALVPKIRPIIVKREIYRFINRRRLCCFRNRQEQLRYHKVVGQKEV